MDYDATARAGLERGARLTVFQRRGVDTFVQLEAGDHLLFDEVLKISQIVQVNRVDQGSLELLVGRTLRRLQPADCSEVPAESRQSGRRVQNCIVGPN